jgi:hypothetical protein
MATTSFVLGEFPWRVKVGEQVLADDYVDPPRLLSSETTNDEVTWSQGEYIPGAEIWKAFNLPGAPPQPQGAYLNQPSPYTGKVWGIWKMFFMMELLLVVVMIAFAMVSKHEVVLEESRQFSPLDKGEPSYVTAPFEFKGRAAPVKLDITTDLSNSSAYFGFALINQDTGQAYDFNKEISYYFGSDSDGAWTEGRSSSSVTIPSVPAGHYYLRVEPEMDTSTLPTNKYAFKGMRYHLTMTHDEPSFIWFLLAGVLLLIPPIWYSIQAKSFEARRWMDSDYAPGSSSKDSSSDD